MRNASQRFNGNSASLNKPLRNACKPLRILGNGPIEYGGYTHWHSVDKLARKDLKSDGNTQNDYSST
jgi:hypothetical protein